MVRISDVLGPNGKMKGKPTKMPLKSSASPEKESKPVQILREEKKDTQPKLSKQPFLTTSAEIKAECELAKETYEKAISFVKDDLYKEKIEPSYKKVQMEKLIKSLVEKLISNNSTLLSLINLPTKNDYFCVHPVNVCILSIEIGLGIGFNQSQLIDLGTKALSHDIEKLEPLKITGHLLHGIKSLSEEKGIDAILRESIYRQHLLENKSSDVNKIKLKNIHSFAKIIGTIEVYELLIHSKVYGERFNSEITMKMITSLKDKSLKFEIKEILKSLLKRISIYPLGSTVQLNLGQIGKVVKLNRDFLLCPIVDIIKEADGTKLKEPKRINLSYEPLFYIGKSVD